jgi:hypothetical protein
MELSAGMNMTYIILALALQLLCGMLYIAGEKQALSLTKEPIEWIAPYFFSFSPFVLLAYLLYEVSHMS